LERLERSMKEMKDDQKENPTDLLNALFREVLEEAW
jgi:hypothetical protein